MSQAQPSPLGRVSAVLNSPALSAVVTVVGFAAPVVGWAMDRVNLKVLLVVQAVLILILAVGHYWTQKTYIQLRRVTNLKAMDNAEYYNQVRTGLEAELISNYNEIADGHLRVFSSDVPRFSALLVNTVTASQAQPQRILAADLTTDPTLLTGRREYISANRRFTEAGGTINRVFIVFATDLAKADFARSLLDLVGQHRDLGVTCGLAVRDRLRAEQAIDAAIFADAAALVEEEQGDVDYQRGRSSVHFKGIGRWTSRFESVWGHGADSAPRTLQAYEAVARPQLDAGTWEQSRIDSAVAGL
ncbi:hypothetical protein J7F03_02840 [Streptomyces sp. ISL-43]|uniref:hypothetical protein n=1 Tax=Streptomyces sp. ISL-43 TaxID=2819183 RepID=UPI001BECFD27|nr:hypothetical protein [Streptomyces sp. ISL-43]MBT2446041.1 hypothetical protein [Streptomyces sp. ISL-43]